MIWFHRFLFISNLNTLVVVVDFVVEMLLLLLLLTGYAKNL